MAGGKNLATKYAGKADERFSRESQAMLAVNSDFEFTGANTVKVYSIPVVAMSDYQRSGANRYGTPNDLTRNVQTLTVTKDRAFSFIIDRGDKLQSEMVTDAGKALARQIREVWVPEFDSYVFRVLSTAATEAGNTDTTEATTGNAYSLFLNAMEKLGNQNVPDKGRVCFCSCKFANLLKQDSAFMRYGDAAQKMLIRGVIGEVDGCKIVKVPSGRLPSGCSFILTHPMAATAPRQLEEYKTHDNPPGISGWLVEGRVIYDCFVLGEKRNAIFYQGGAGGMKLLTVGTAATSSGKSTVLIIPGQHDANGVKWYYDTAAATAELATASYGTAITTASWTEMADCSAEITPDSSDKVIRVVEVDQDGKPIALGNAVLNIG